MPRYELRRATLDDLDTLVVHRRRMWEDLDEYEVDELDAADPVYRRWARQRLRTGRLVGWVADAPGEGAVASGCVWVMRVQPRPGHPSGDQPYLLSMYTAPEHRGQGLARRIVVEAKKWARAQGYPRMTLHAAPMGRRIYEKEGFERTWEMRFDL